MTLTPRNIFARGMDWKGSTGKMFRGLRTFLSYVGPGYVIAVGYLDPGNWATDLAGGSEFGYKLLFVILLANIVAVMLQSITVRMGVVTERDLAQNCRHYFPKWVNWGLYVLAEGAIIATDLAEVIGSAIALNLLTGLSLPIGVAITGVDVLIILLFYREGTMRAARILEVTVMVLVSTVAICFIIQLVYAKPNGADVMAGYLPSKDLVTNPSMLYVAIGIIGATVMPHNLYLHSHLVQIRAHKNRVQAEATDPSHLHGHSNSNTLTRVIRSTIKMSVIDTVLALTVALFVNSAILIVAGAAFFYGGKPPESVASLFDAHALLSSTLGKAAGFCFAFALLIAGQSSTLTATLAGQVVMSGFIGMTVRPWLRRIVTRALAIIPAMIVAIARGSDGLNDLLVASQVALSIQLPFAMVPLVALCAMPRVMTVRVNRHNAITIVEGAEDAIGEKVVEEKEAHVDDLGNAKCCESTVESTVIDPSEEDGNYKQAKTSDLINFANPLWLTVLGGIASVIIIGLNVFMVVQAIKGDGA
ncbi:uncharacterized protein VTP21DRAFT_783 [Calcarisporiella thermophila]|uniref:uncharacterized protein n=1 Tax=Calcarisporiella thermophila TaxID=911321 RepID=UPI003741EECE